MSTFDDGPPDVVRALAVKSRSQEENALAIADASPSLPIHLEGLADRARGYVEAAKSANTRRAYASDWKHFAA